MTVRHTLKQMYEVGREGHKKTIQQILLLFPNSLLTLTLHYPVLQYYHILAFNYTKGNKWSEVLT
jgi:hypothetical protein